MVCNADYEEAMHMLRQRAYRKSLYLSHNFAVKPNCSKKTILKKSNEQANKIHWVIFILSDVLSKQETLLYSGHSILGLKLKSISHQFLSYTHPFMSSFLTLSFAKIFPVRQYLCLLPVCSYFVYNLCHWFLKLWLHVLVVTKVTY